MTHANLPKDRAEIFWRWKSQDFRTWRVGYVVHTGNDEVIKILSGQYAHGGDFVSVAEIEWKPKP